jgi:hypothetical protein
MRSITAARLSARLNILAISRCGKIFRAGRDIRVPAPGADHLLANYPAKGSTQGLRNCVIATFSNIRFDDKALAVWNPST